MPNIQLYRADMSRPARGGWIEIRLSPFRRGPIPSRPARGGWIEMVASICVSDGAKSRPARGGWIEMVTAKRWHAQCAVPPRKGRVD